MSGSEFLPKPAPTDLSAPFWRSGLDGVLRLQRCEQCGHIRYPLSTICPECLEANHTWTALSGRGSVQTFVTFERAYDPSWADAVPYVVALIELEEGPVMLSNVIGTPADQVRVGQHVEIVYERISAEAALPQFRIAAIGTSR